MRARAPRAGGTSPTSRRPSPTPHVETFDVVVDADWRPVRLRADTGEHQHPARAATAARSAAGATACRSSCRGSPTAISTTSRPATNLITTKRLTDTAEIDVVFLEPVTLEPTLVRQRYELQGVRGRRHAGRTVRRHQVDVHVARQRLDVRSVGRGRRRRPLRPAVRAGVVRGGRERSAADHRLGTPNDRPAGGADRSSELGRVGVTRPCGPRPRSRGRPSC